MQNTSIDVRQAACQVCGDIENPSDTFLIKEIPFLLNCCRDKNTAVKAAADDAVSSLLHLSAGGYSSRLKVCISE